MVYLILVVQKSRPINIHRIVGAFNDEKEAEKTLIKYVEEHPIDEDSKIVIKEYENNNSEKYYIHYIFCNCMGYYDFIIQGVYSNLSLVPRYKKRSKFSSYMVVRYKSNKVYTYKKPGVPYHDL